MVYVLTTLLLFFASCASVNKNFNTNLNTKKSLNMSVPKSALADERSIFQELTGKADPSGNLPSDEQLKNKPLSVRHYYAGLRAVQSKNYILAIKQFNTVVQKYPNSPEVKLSFLAKSKLYKEMGLSEPSSYNFNLAQNIISPVKLGKKNAKVKDNKKVTK